MYQCKTERGFHGKTLNTASVSVVPTPGRELTAEQAAAIRNLVAGAISGMKPEDVTVTDIKNGRSFHGSLDGGDGSMGGEYAARQTRGRTGLETEDSRHPGARARRDRRAERRIGPDQAAGHPNGHAQPQGHAVRTMEKTTERTREGAGPAGQPGFKANQPNALPATAGRGTTDTESQSEAIEEIVVGGTEEEKETVPMTPTRVTVAIGVPSSYFQKVWLEQNPAPPGEEQKKPTATELAAVQTQVIDGIQKLVAKLLPPAEGVANPTDLVQVLPFPDLTAAGDSRADDDRNGAGLAEPILEHAGHARPGRGEPRHAPLDGPGRAGRGPRRPSQVGHGRRRRRRRVRGGRSRREGRFTRRRLLPLLRQPRVAGRRIVRTGPRRRRSRRQHPPHVDR